MGRAADLPHGRLELADGVVVSVSGQQPLSSDTDNNPLLVNIIRPTV